MVECIVKLVMTSNRIRIKHQEYDISEICGNYPELDKRVFTDIFFKEQVATHLDNIRFPERLTVFKTYQYLKRTDCVVLLVIVSGLVMDSMILKQSLSLL